VALVTVAVLVPLLAIRASLTLTDSPLLVLVAGFAFPLLFTLLLGLPFWASSLWQRRPFARGRATSRS
jgi:hypothetical protein